MDTTHTESTGKRAYIGYFPTYRLDTHADGIPFRPGAKTVVIDGWGFSGQSPITDYDTWTTRPGCRISCFRPNQDHPDTWDRHPTLNGMEFATFDDAKPLAYQLGVLGMYVTTHRMNFTTGQYEEVGQ